MLAEALSDTDSAQLGVKRAEPVTNGVWARTRALGSTRSLVGETPGQKAGRLAAPCGAIRGGRRFAQIGAGDGHKETGVAHHGPGAELERLQELQHALLAALAAEEGGGAEIFGG